MKTTEDHSWDAQEALLELFNNTLAGHLASQELNEALCRDWLPAMVRLLKPQATNSPDTVLVRRFMVRLGWLLRNLPQADHIHAGLLDRAIRECRTDWRALLPQLIPEKKLQIRSTALLDRELLDCLNVSTTAHRYSPPFPRHPIAPLTAVRAAPVPVHPHDREASGSWRAVFAGSREQRRGDEQVKTALAKVSCLRAGDRVMMLLPGGLRETWRVLRREAARDNVLLENEDTHRQGVLGLQTMASQLERGRLAILG